MYSNLHFAITLLGIFSIFEIFKGGQKLSVLKYHILARLLMIVAGSFFDYLALDGYEIPYYHEIFRLIAAVLFVNMLFLIVRKKIPKIVIGLEVFFTLYFIIQFIYGFQIPNIKNGILQNKPSTYQIIFFGTYTLFVISTLIYNGLYLIRNKNFNTNIYEFKIKRWVFSYIICLMALAFINLLLLLSVSNKTFTFYDDSIITSFAQRFLFILFVLFRPKFLDDDRHSMPFNELLIKAKGIAFKDFELYIIQIIIIYYQKPIWRI